MWKPVVNKKVQEIPCFHVREMLYYAGVVQLLNSCVWLNLFMYQKRHLVVCTVEAV